MNPIKSNFSIHEPLSPTFEQTQPEEAATGVSEGRDVTLYHNNNSPFLELPELIHSKIILCLGLREVTRLAKVCKYLRDFVKAEKALERAWSRRFPSFPSPHQYQLKATINTKDEHQLRAWLKPFANKETIESLIKQQENIHFPAQLLFTNSKLMTLCKKFELVEKLEITHGDRVYEANFSPDGQHLVTASRDKTAKIYGLEDDGSWKRKAIITHDEWVRTAIFSPDGRYLVTAGHDETAKIYGLKDDGSWEEKTIITHNNYLVSATFIGDGRRVVTASFGDSVKITGRGNNESWELEDAFHKNTICSTRLSPDGHHMIIFYAVNFVIEIHGQSAAGLWAVTSTIQTESGARSARFSADSCHLVIITFASKAIICDLLADGSWKKMGTIKHGFWIKSANFSADCLHVVTASEDHKAKIHSQNAGSWEEKACIEHDKVVTSANFSADCQHVVTASDDNTAKISSLQTDGSWKLKANIVHQDKVLSASFSADACHVVTASVDGVVNIYGLEANGSWLQKAAIQKKTGFTAASFSADSRNVVTVSQDNKVRITELRKKN